MTAPATFTVWKDHFTGDFEIVCWVGGKHTVVQRNIRTRQKADAAVKIWRDREKQRVGA